jgi:DNA processing protein
MSIEHNRLWLALSAVPRLKCQHKLELVEQFGIESLFNQPKSILIAAGLTEKQALAIISPRWQAIDQIITQSVQCQSHIIHYQHPHYPTLLKQLYDPPLVLFAKGQSALLAKPQIAIVGSRNASIYGREISEWFAKTLVEHQLVVTSGLALGIDAFAHKGALHYSNSTIAVVATGLDQVYPARHKVLQQNIIDSGGVIISEFFPQTPARAGHFPKRNRLISGLSYGVIVIEAALRSGSLITARCAIEQNRELFAVPGSIFNQQNQGCHWLIKQGAKLIESVADIKEEYPQWFKSSIQSTANTLVANEDEKNLLKHLLNDPMLANVGDEVTPIDVIAARCQQPIEQVLTRLMQLELSGLVSAVPGGYLRVNRG